MWIHRGEKRRRDPEDEASTSTESDPSPSRVKRSAVSPTDAPTTGGEGRVDAARFLRARGRTFEGLTYETQRAWKREFCFIQMADPQFGMFQQNKGWEEEEAMMSLAVDHINRLKPRFVVVVSGAAVAQTIVIRRVIAAVSVRGGISHARNTHHTHSTAVCCWGLAGILPTVVVPGQ